jgi:curved DNA-binding protein
MTDPYATLGVAFGASLDECKTAFRNEAKKCHPDLNPNNPAAEARFKEINAAYDAITNPQPEQQQPDFNSHNPFFGFNFTNFTAGGRSPFDDLFAHMRGGQRAATMHEARISLEEAFYGKEIIVRIQNPPPDGGMRELKVMVPPGVEDGMRLVVQHGNHHSEVLHILIRVQPHPRLTRQGPNLSTIVAVTAFDVLLGNEVEVVGIDGHSMRVAIPANFDSTRKLRLAGQGMADAHGNRGSLLVELFIQYPTVPQDQIESLRNIADASATWT